MENSTDDPGPIVFSMNLDQFLRRARDRGLMLKSQVQASGRLVVVDESGRRPPYAIPRAALDVMLESLIGDLLYHFCDEENVELLLREFQFDPTIDED